MGDTEVDLGNIGSGFRAKVLDGGVIYLLAVWIDNHLTEIDNVAFGQGIVDFLQHLNTNILVNYSPSLQLTQKNHPISS